MNKNKLFIGNLHYSVTEDQLRVLFSPYGNLISVKVMQGKGYGFIEMGTPEEAQKIKDTLSESVFQGRRLLIDGVPSKKSEPRKWASLSDEPHRSKRRPERRDNQDRRSRAEGTGQPEERTHHLTDVTDEFRKSKKTEPKSEKPTVRIGQYATPVTEQTKNKGVSAGKDQLPPDSEKKSTDSRNHQKGKNSPPSGKGKNISHPGNKDGSDHRPKETKPKKIKEKPPKNPHPYQGSKKAKTAQKPDQKPEQGSPEPQEDERISYLKYMASRTGKKE